MNDCTSELLLPSALLRIFAEKCLILSHFVSFSETPEPCNFEASAVRRDETLSLSVTVQLGTVPSWSDAQGRPPSRRFLMVPSNQRGLRPQPKSWREGFCVRYGNDAFLFRSTCPSPSERRRQSPNGSPPPERVRDRRGRRGVEGEECGGVSAGGMAYAPPGRSSPRRQPPFKSEAHAGSADFDFLAGIPAAGTPAKKLVRIARMP